MHLTPHSFYCLLLLGSDYNLDYGRNPNYFDGSVPVRSSDHSPVLLGLDLSSATSAPSAAPSAVPTAAPSAVPTAAAPTPTPTIGRVQPTVKPVATTGKPVAAKSTKKPLTMKPTKVYPTKKPVTMKPTKAAKLFE